MNARTKIVAAAEAIVLRDGIANVTLDSIIRESGVSKSGLIYHFRSKEEILEALTDTWLERGREILAVGDDPADVERRTLAHAECNFAGPQSPLPVSLAIALVSSRALLPRLVQLQREIDALEAGLPEELWVTAMLRRMALDGLWWSDLLDVERFTDEERERIARCLIGTSLPE